MATVPVPVIREEHYQAFLALPTIDIPKTFDELRNDQANDERNFIASGIDIERIEIYAEDFSKFSRESCIPMNFHSIKALVTEKSRRQRNAKQTLCGRPWRG
jgi:hypothetical protein